MSRASSMLVYLGSAVAAITLVVIVGLLLFSLSLGIFTGMTYLCWWLLSAAFGIAHPTLLGSLAIGACLAVVSTLLGGTKATFKKR